MTVDVLGPLETGAQLRPRERALLAALVAKAGQVVTPDELAAAYWGDNTPPTWWQQIKTGVTAIRARLGADVIVTHHTGYSLGVDPSAIDAVRFERLVSSARAHALDEADERAVDAFTRALALWRGPALPEVEHWRPAHLEARRWEELRRDAEEELLEARLRCGETREVVPAAESLVAAAPMRENRWRILVLALYRSERQADALAALRAARLRLHESLGVEPGEKLRSLEAAILTQDPQLSAPPPSDTVSELCPYQGLRVFDTDSADRFYGRETEVLELTARIRPGTLTVVSGASGTGKSSLVRAGVIPVLEQGGRTVKVLGNTPRGVLAQLSDRDLIGDVLVADQFEEVLRSEPELRESIDSALGGLLQAGASIVLTVRSDFLDDAVRLPTLGDAVAQGVFLLGPLSPNSMRAAIEQPARAAGLRLEQGLTELMLRDAGGHPSALPHLSYALVQTWARREGATLTVEGYEASGGLAAAISQAAEKCYQSFQIRERELCQSLFLRLFEPGPAGSATARRIPLNHLLGDDRRRHVIEELVRTRLCATDGDALAVAHEAVASAWPRLRSWLDEDAHGAQLLRELEEASRAWGQAGRTDDDLFRGARLHAALTWRDTSQPDITPAETAFLEASAAREQAEIIAVSERAQTEQRLNRRLRWALGGAAVLLTGALVSTSVAVVRGSDAVRAETDALIEALAATSQSLVSTDRDVAALLAAEVHRRSPDDARARSAILAVAAASGSPTRKILFPEDAYIFGTAIPGTDNVLVHETAIPATDYSTARLTEWNAATGELVRVLPATLPAARTPEVGAIAFSPDARFAAVVTPTVIESRLFEPCCGAVVATVDLASGTLLATANLSQVTPFAGAVFTREGELVLRSFGAVDLLWLDPSTLKVVGTGPTGRRTEDGSGLTMLTEEQIAISWSDRIDVYDGQSRQLLRTIPLADDVASFGLTAVPGGMITTGPAGMAMMDAMGQRTWSQPQSFTCFRAIAVPGSDSFLCPDPDTHEFHLSDGTPTGRIFSAQSQWVIGGSVLADGSLAVINQRTTPSVQRFPLDGTGPLSSLAARGKVSTDGFADDRTLIVAEREPAPDADPGNAETMWDVITDSPVGTGAAAIDVVDRDVVARWSVGDTRPVLSDVSGSDNWSLTGPVFEEAVRVSPVAGGSGGRAFAINSDVILVLDPNSGEEVGPALDFIGKRLDENWTTVHELPGADRAVVSWWDVDESRMITGVFDLSTGQELARGLYGDTTSVVLPDGDIISTSSSRMRRSDEALTPLDTLAKPVAGANKFEISDDGQLLLVQGAKGSSALYDTATGIKLGTDIVADSPYWEPAHLAPDGHTLATNASEGVLLWNLDPGSFQQAACRLAGKDLTAEEWRRYVGDGPQVKLCNF